MQIREDEQGGIPFFFTSLSRVKYGEYNFAFVLAFTCIFFTRRKSAESSARFKNKMKMEKIPRYSVLRYLISYTIRKRQYLRVEMGKNTMLKGEEKK